MWCIFGNENIFTFLLPIENTEDVLQRLES